ncbi:MAG: LptF/LptG family permease, partial [Bacteroidota bacterium]|nr:LptF/LptG family permease [Bacteroidota bacterium]
SCMISSSWEEKFIALLCIAYRARVKKLFKLTTLSFIGPFFATFFIVLFVLLLQFLWVYIDDLVGKGLEWYVILELLFYASASFVPFALPLSILLSSIMTFGKLAETFELLALKSAGISLLRVMVPQITLVTLITISAFFFANNVIPRANLKFKSLLWDIRQQRPALDIKEGVFYGGLDNYSIRITKKDKNSQKIEGITIYDHTNGRGNVVVMVAERGEMAMTKDKRFLIFTLYNGIRYEEMENKNPAYRTYPHNRLKFASYEMHFDLTAFDLSRTKEELFKEHYEMMNVTQLDYYRDSMKRSLGLKRAEVLSYGRPYFGFFRDTTYHYNAHTGFDTSNTLRDFIKTFPKSERAGLVKRAMLSARSIRDVLAIQAREIEEYNKLIIRYQMEWHRKFALSFACLTLFFIGAPLGAIIRKGGIGMPTVVSVLLFILFYIIMITAQNMAKQGAISPFAGMWMPSIVLLPLGLFLTHKANTDTISFSSDGLRRAFRNLSRRKRKKKAAKNP